MKFKRQILWNFTAARIDISATDAFDEMRLRLTYASSGTSGTPHGRKASKRAIHRHE